MRATHAISAVQIDIPGVRIEPDRLREVGYGALKFSARIPEHDQVALVQPRGAAIVERNGAIGRDVLADLVIAVQELIFLSGCSWPLRS